MMAKEADPLEKSVKKIEQQGIINRNDKIDMTKMTWTKKLTLAAGFATALKKKNNLHQTNLESITHKNINHYLRKNIYILQNYQEMNSEPVVNISCQVKLGFYQKIK